MTVISLKCLSQITNDVIESDIKEKTMTFFLIIQLPQKGYLLVKCFRDSSGSPRSPGVDPQGTQYTNTIAQGFIWHPRVYSRPGSTKGKKQKDWGLCYFSVLAYPEQGFRMLLAAVLPSFASSAIS